MHVMTLKLPDDLHAALNAVSHQRGVSKSEVVREALQQSLLQQGIIASAAQQWVQQWQGQLKLPEVHAVSEGDDRLAHLLQKHVR